MKKSIKYSLIAGIVIILALTFYFYPKNLSNEEYVENLEIVENEDILSVNYEKQNTQNKQTPQKIEPLPITQKLEVAFIPQAPFYDWSEPWQNACEEAALLTLHHYIQGDKEVAPEEVKQEILEMLEWQDNYFGSHKDLNMAEVAKMAQNYLGYENVKVFYDIEIEDIKIEIVNGNTVLIPAAGQILDNPNFTSPGPVYHNVVVIGYTEDKIITNDPGTRNGANFEYTYDNFYNSVHDYVEGAGYSNPEKMMNGKRAMLVINN